MATPRRYRIEDRTGLLLLPPLLLFVVFMVLPLLLLFAIGFNPSMRGMIGLQPAFSIENFRRFFTEPLFYGALLNSLKLGGLTVVACLVLGYPLAYIMARTQSPRTFLMLNILVLASMQLDMTVRLYGLTTIFGNNNGLINQLLAALGVPKVNFLYNLGGVALGQVQFTLPFMVFSLVGVLRNIDLTYEQAARGLGAGRWRAFFDITLPLSIPAIVSGSVIVFALSIAGYIVPTLLGSSRIPTIAMQLYQQVNELGFWQFGAAIGFVLFSVSSLSILLAFRLSQRSFGGQL